MCAVMPKMQLLIATVTTTRVTIFVLNVHVALLAGEVASEAVVVAMAVVMEAMEEEEEEEEEEVTEAVMTGEPAVDAPALRAVDLITE